jgi:hypothetical protein
MVGAICGGFSLGECLELFRKGDVIEESPGVIELVIPSPFEVAHCEEKVLQFFVAHKGEKGRIYAWRVWTVGAVIVGAPEWFGGFANSCEGSVRESGSKY